MSQKKPQTTFDIHLHFLIEDMPIFSVYQRVILCHVHRRGFCWEGVRKLAEAKNMSVGSARNARKWLLDNDYIMEYSHNGKDGLCVNRAKFEDRGDHVATQSDHLTAHHEQKGDHLMTQSDHVTTQGDHLTTQSDHVTTHKEESKNKVKNKEKKETPPPHIGSDMNGTLIPKSYGNHYQDFEDSNRELTRNGGEILGYLFDICHHIPRTKGATARELSHYLDSQGIDSATVKNALSSPTGYWCAHDWRGKKGDKPHLSQVETAIMEHVAMQDKIKLAKERTATMGAMFYG